MTSWAVKILKIVFFDAETQYVLSQNSYVTNVLFLDFGKWLWQT